ncbi:pentapeptide repeat-containing protein [Okeania sp. SIO2B3]|uniref:pentapeptide repeat-containing protein n=1 Tax=Okeania sp. SIO2B3 TaxID=2607784 RepID=UPI0013BECCBF|nr:pentapeptide repeat-containing protein [Okeania sp. SIO2B3]NET41891.1 pentapeptide repeat-containing protein [Okeania sp. SIO2B3]
MNRRKREILQQYQQGERNFQGANLRGLSFKGENLSDADFSFADIRGTNFSGVNLRGAKFCGAKAGLQKRWVVVLLAGAFVLVCISAYLSLFISIIFLMLVTPVLIKGDSSDLMTQIAGWVCLIITIISWMRFVSNKIEDSAFPGAIAGALTVAIAVCFSVAGMFTGIVIGAFAVAGAFVFTFIEVFALIGTFAVAGVVAVAVAGTFTVSGTLALNVFIYEFLLESESFGFGFIGAGTLFQTLLSAYIACQAIKGDKKYSLIRNTAIAFAAIGGTSFRDANLTDTDFTNATLKSTDFRGANITRTIWKNTIKLDRIRPGKTYLKDAKVRELVKTGEGENINLDRFALQGINLRGANLTNASFIEANLNLANLQDANLSRAKLVGTFLDQADLTGATLTGAFLEDWGITTTTKLDDIKCDYIYMRLPPDKRPDFLKLPPEQSLDERVRRKPADEDKNFEEGEFAEFIKPLVNTLDLYHNQGVDPRIAAYSFEKLQKDHPEAEIKMRSFEVRGENNDKLLIRADTKPEADHSILDKEYFDTYNELKALSPEQLRAVLAQREKDIEWYKGVLSAAVNRPGVNIENYSNQGDTKMSESSGDQIHAQEIHGAVANKEKIDGFAGSGREIYGLAGKGEIKDSKIARTIHESQEQQNLAQAAKDIQELLAQLDETYPSDTTAGKMKIATEVITQIDNNTTKAGRIFSAIKAGGIAGVEQFLNHPASSFIIAALEDWQKTK